MNNHQRNNIFLRCCYGYAVSGMATLIIGAILPFVIEEAGISFLAAGGLLSAMAVGNLSSSFCFPVIVLLLGRKRAIFLATLLAPVCLFVLSYLPGLVFLYGIMLIYGFVKGCITILNNAAVNDIYEEGTAGKLNILHCSFAVGAFLAPFLTAILMKLGFGWRISLYLILLLTITSAAAYGTMDGRLLAQVSKVAQTEKVNGRFLKSFSFYCLAFVLFFYLGVENCINGWFVTYLQNTGVMSAPYATTLVSFTWLAIMGGRLLCAALSKKWDKNAIILINALGSAACFFLLITTKSLPLVTGALLGFGFFLSGIFPTCIASARPFIQGSTMGMALLTAISAAGGILTPQLVGAVADRRGIVGAVGILTVNIVFVIFFSVINFRRR